MTILDATPKSVARHAAANKSVAQRLLMFLPGLSSPHNRNNTTIHNGGAINYSILLITAIMQDAMSMSMMTMLVMNTSTLMISNRCLQRCY